MSEPRVSGGDTGSIWLEVHAHSGWKLSDYTICSAGPEFQIADFKVAPAHGECLPHDEHFCITDPRISWGVAPNFPIRGHREPFLQRIEIVTDLFGVITVGVDAGRHISIEMDPEASHGPAFTRWVRKDYGFRSVAPIVDRGFRLVTPKLDPEPHITGITVIANGDRLAYTPGEHCRFTVGFMAAAASPKKRQPKSLAAAAGRR